MDNSIYLSQSYRDAWDDYQRSLKSRHFPRWDFIILTASNEHQAAGFRAQIRNREGYLPSHTKFAVIPDEGGVRVGSGGATFSVLRYLREQEGMNAWSDRKILVIHSGGDSKRAPQYSAVGKLFSPVPHQLPDGRSSTIFDEFLIAMSAVPGRIQEGMLFLSGDVLLLFNPLLIDWSGSGAAVISFKEDVSIGKDHGVYLKGPDGNVRQFLHKQSTEKLKAAGAVNEDGCVDIDTGAILLGVDILNSLWSLISTEGIVNEQKYRSFVNEKVRLSLYGDFQYPLATDSTLPLFYAEKPEEEYSAELKECRTALWNALHHYRLKLLCFAPAKFIHFGTTCEIRKLMTEGVDRYADLGWSRTVNSSTGENAGYNSVVSTGADVGEGCYLEASCVHRDAHIGSGTILSYIDIHDETVPPNVVLHGLKQTNGKFVCRIFGVGDNPKENKLFGKQLPEELGNTLWLAPVYPERDTIKEAVAAALKLYEQVMENRWSDVVQGKSLASGFNDADPEAILAWNKRMTELAAIDVIRKQIDSHMPASQVHLQAPLTKVQAEWMESMICNADYSEQMRLHYYAGMAAKDEGEIAKAFSTLSAAIINENQARLKENTTLRISKDSLEVKLPLRVNWGGGWSDTPPYCNENGGTVLNAAILLNGKRPVSVRLHKIEEHKIVLESRDMDAHREFTTIAPLQSVGDPYDPYGLQKAALLACGVIPSSGGDLEAVLNRLGGGIRMDTEVTGVPQGSGLGTSSILAAACVKALFEFLGLKLGEDDLYSKVLCMEQMMSTGGGWQDQVGGVTDGIKYITSKPGLAQSIRVSYLSLDPAVVDELNERFALIYTGQRRLARNLLRDVVGRYIGNEPETVFALNEIQRIAVLMRFELERGHVDDFAILLSKHWELSKKIDKDSSNTLIDQIFGSVDDLLAGKMVCGAGGGGFLQVMLKKGVSRTDLQERLKAVFSDTNINVWDCRLV